MSEASKTPVPETRPVCSACGQINGEHLTQCPIAGLQARLTEALDRAQRAEEQLENERMKVAGCSTASVGAWKEGDSLHPDYECVAIHDVARMYARCAQQSSKIAELEKDAARLDWWGGDIRNAIDKAMAEGKPTREALASSGQGATEPSS